MPRWIGWFAGKFAFRARRSWTKVFGSFPAHPWSSCRLRRIRSIWDRLANSLPQALPSADQAIFQPTPAGFRLAVETGRRETQAAFFPEDQNILDNPAPQTLTPTPKGLILELKKDPNLTASPAQLKGVLELAGGRNYEIARRRPGTTVGRCRLRRPRFHFQGWRASPASHFSADCC